jgi:hypothetical protein
MDRAVGKEVWGSATYAELAASYWKRRNLFVVTSPAVPWENPLSCRAPAKTARL